MFIVYMVHQMGFEPTRLPTRPSSVRVCQFRHWCIYLLSRDCSLVRPTGVEPVT